ncbi:proline-rich domain-containing protein [Micromonospora echinospora]|uniref:proline-rich domain-containing protein n=1 Tax=Micromonospora echinospora TaxID=1877 RepID=UPI0033CA75EE
MTTPPPPGHPPQPPYGQPSYGQPPYGNSPQPPYGNPSPGYPQPGNPPPGHPQPGNHPPGYPTGHPGYPPPPAPTAKRIPEDQPFVVRPSVAKRGLLMGGVVLALLSPIVCLAGIGMANSADPDTRANAVLAVVGILVCLLAAVGLPLGIQLWLIASGGPVLALSPAGLWIRTRPTRGQAVWVPWEAVAQIRRRRWSFEKMLVVQLRDPRMLQNLGAYTALDSSMLSAFYGSGLVSTLNFADRSEQEIVAAVTHFSAGRCPLTL